MNGYAGTTAPPGGMYVKALYDYDADDRTSLSFRQGEIIQVITQLESGWWDGVINGVRGWFPSNYCQLVNGPIDEVDEDESNRRGPVSEDGEGVSDAGTEEYEDVYSDLSSERSSQHGRSRAGMDGASDQEQEEAAFWIPQATPDGRLYYFNTLTGVSTMELPLETPSSTNESGPRDRTNVFMPESTRPPPELMAGGRYEREDDTDYGSASDNERSAVEESIGSLVRSISS